MEYLLLPVILLAVALLIAILRTIFLKAPKYTARALDFPEEAMNDYARKLGEMISIPTLSKNEDEDLSQFYAYHKKLEQLFPNVHKTLDLKVLQGTLIYRWHGTDRERRPILLMGHQDVVPATEKGWRVDAFSGEVIENKVYGRGAQDCKGTMFAQLQAVEELVESGFEPGCDVYLAYAINEETGGNGAKNAVQYLKDQGITLAFAMDEGGGILDKAMDAMDRPCAVIGITEKGYMDVKITAHGKGGHSSAPPKNTPAARLFAFANELERKRPFKKKMLSESAEMLSCMAPYFPFGLRFLMGNLWLFRPLIKMLMPMVSSFGEAVMATTCCFTMMRGSDAPNVIPDEPYLIANLRTTSFQGCDASLAVLQKYAKKYDLSIEVIQRRDASPVSNSRSAEYAYVKNCIAHQFPGIGITPYIIMGGTDCRHFHALTENALRFSAVPMSFAQVASCHAVNENVDITALCEGVCFYKYLIQNYNL